MKYPVILFFTAILFGGCCKDHSDLVPGQNFIPDEILDEIIANGQPIYEGYDPPNLEGTYLIAPLIRTSSNFPDSQNDFADKTVRFFDFKRNSLTLKVSTEQSGNLGDGFGSFISGEGNNFTVYVRIDTEKDDGGRHLSTQIYSGTVTGSGIEDLTTSFFMIDDYGDVNDNLIEIGQGRTFIDGDGFSPKQ